MLLGGCNEEELQVKVENIQISRSTTARLLGMDIDEDLKWKTHMQNL
jgi:hypothetical protein